MELHSAYHHYSDYQLIPASDYRGRIRYYDRYKEYFTLLDRDQKLDIDLDYSKALFEVGNYYRYTQVVDPLIEEVIIHNVYKFGEENVFESLLFRKAAALHNLGKYEQSISILKSLTKIDPKHPLAKRLLALSIRKRGKYWYELMKGISVVCMFSAVSILIAELLIVGPFYLDYLNQVKILRSALISISLIILVVRELAMIYAIRKESVKV